jgi:hypothetical protein
MADLTMKRAGFDRECPHCKGSMPRDADACPQCGGQSPAWTFREGRWWVSVDHVWYWLDEATRAWNPMPTSPRGVSRRTIVKLALIGAAVVLLAGGCAGFLVWASHYDARLKQNVTAAMRELPMGSTPADMRRRLGDPDYVLRRQVHGQRAFCMQYTIAVFGEEDLRTACYVHGRRVK